MFSRVPFSYCRMLDEWWMIFPFAWIVIIGVLALRSARTRGESALRLSFLVAIGISLLVNDSPGTIALAGLGSAAAICDPYLHDELRRLLARFAPALGRSEPVPIEADAERR